MSTSGEKRIDESAATITATTCSSSAAKICIDRHNADDGVQLCVFSAGFNIEGVVAHLLAHAFTNCRDASNLFVVLVPHGADTLVARVAHNVQTALHALRCPLAERVGKIEDGTSTKDRCTVYREGGVFVCSTRILCMDMLHRRLSSDLVVFCAILFPKLVLPTFRLDDGSISNAAFCVNILLRGRTGATTAADGGAGPTHVVMLCDDPVWMRMVLQRHHVGFDDFVHQLHISDIQLFPRFRLTFMKHFERLSKEKSLPIDCLVVEPDRDRLVLDKTIVSILKEIHQELQKLESRLAPGGSRGAAGAASRDGTRALMLNDDTMLLRPRTKQKYETKADGALPMYAQKPWRCGGTGRIVLFSRITEEIAVDVATKDLDVDIALALRANDGAWPFRSLAESLLDVRHLLRMARYGTKYSFFLALARLLEQKARPVAALGGASTAPPHALWTLSSHFSDVLTVATHRIGEVSESPAQTSASELTMASSGGVDDDDEVEFLGAKPSAASRAAPAVAKHIKPHLEEPDPVLDIIHRVVCSWALRRLNSTAAEAAVSPVMVIAVAGSRERYRVECRLRYVKTDFEKFEFNRFIESYQTRYGVVIEKKPLDVRQPTGSGGAEATAMTKMGKADEEEDIADADDEPETTFRGVEDEDGEGDEEGEVAGRKSLPLPHRFTQSVSTQPVTEVNLPWHHALLTAGATLNDPQDVKRQRSVVLFNEVVSRTDRATVLRPNAFATDGNVHSVEGTTSVPLVCIVDIMQWTTSEFLDLLGGSAHHLRRANTTDSSVATGPPPALGGAFAVQRILLTQKHIGVMRLMEMCQDELPAGILSHLKAQLVSSSFSDADFKRSIEQEREGFESLAHVKANLTGSLLTSRGSLRQTEEQLESGLALATSSSSRRFNYFTNRALPLVGSVAAPPMIIVDERDFRSSLPYSLYARGIDIIPLTLVTGDYVLSADCAVERKSVSDYLMSLNSRRIYHQLSALSRRFKYPILLIEFQRHQPFRLAFSNDRGLCTDVHSLTNLYTDTAKLVAAFPTLRVMWSRSPAHTAAMFYALKKGIAKDNADPSSSALTSLGMDAFSEVATAEAEKVHYAKRVLLRFPGITPQNMDAVMRAAGTLAGLASISLELLQTAMGNENAKVLFDFIHSSFNIEVE